MILDGNSKVGNAKVYATQKEMDQEKQIERLNIELNIKNNCIETLKIYSRIYHDKPKDYGEIISECEKEVVRKLKGLK